MSSHSGSESASDSGYDSFDSHSSGREVSQAIAKKTKKTRGMTVMKEVINWINKGNPKFIVRYFQLTLLHTFNCFLST